GATNGAESAGKDFAKALTEAISKVNGVQKDADIAIANLSEGKASLHETMIAIEKAGISFELMLQVRNKIVTAYEDIMRTQV
ncbi:MAG: flagellar hook-basal body complex protein FliE, partial [Thermodesulfobacteriota bacterium]